MKSIREFIRRLPSKLIIYHWQNKNNTMKVLYGNILKATVSNG